MPQVAIETSVTVDGNPPVYAGDGVQSWSGKSHMPQHATAAEAVP